MQQEIKFRKFDYKFIVVMENDDYQILQSIGDVVHYKIMKKSIKYTPYKDMYEDDDLDKLKAYIDIQNEIL